MQRDPHSNKGRGKSQHGQSPSWRWPRSLCGRPHRPDAQPGNRGVFVCPVDQVTGLRISPTERGAGRELGPHPLPETGRAWYQAVRERSV